MLIDQIKELVQLMVDNDLSTISLRNGTEEVVLRRATLSAQSVPHGPKNEGSDGAVKLPTGDAATAPATDPESPGAGGPDDGLVEIRSPIVGTFYAASGPESPPFAEVGASLTPDSVVCIIEAMKVFNEIRAEVTGTLEKILVKNEQPVEYGQPLFLVRPATA